jgi:hypothetical protein
MSKLKISVSIALTSMIFAGLFVWKKPTISQNTHPLSPLFSEETRLWGKAAGPVQVRIEFKEQNGNQVTLLGQVRSTLPQFQIDWKLPEGVRLVSGNPSEVVQQEGDAQVLHDREITVEVDWPLSSPHLVLRAAENETPEALGATTVFNLDPSLEDLEKQDIIRAHMKSRNLQKIVK